MSLSIRFERHAQRRDTSANWTSVNPVLYSGEIGLETDTGQFKFGDGVTPWTGLAYFAAAGAARVPTVIAAGTTYTVPAGYQVLFKIPIAIGTGTLRVIGDLVEVT